VFLPPSIEFASAEEEFLYVFSSPLSPEVVKLMYAPPNEQLDDQEKGGKNEIVLANLFLFLFQREWKYIAFFFNSRIVIKKS